MDADFDALPAPPLTTEERVNNVEQRTDALESANDDLILMMADLLEDKKDENFERFKAAHYDPCL